MSSKKTILITGSSSGIGKATVKYFQEKGWNVAATMRNIGKETELGNLENVKLYTLDVTDSSSIKKAIEAAIQDFGKIDVILNNAGFGAVGIFESSTDEQIQKQFDTNVFGVMRTIKEILPHFRKNKSGMIINITSAGGILTLPLYSLYHGTKWALEGFSESLSYELASFGIKVKLVEPGAVKTDFNSRSQVKIENKELTDYQTYSDKVISNYEKFSSSPDFGNPASAIAETIYQAATDDSDKMRYVSPETDLRLMETLKMRQNLPLNEFMKMIRSFYEA